MAFSTQPRPEFGHPGQGGVVGGAQLGRVRHTVQMADGAPGAAQIFGGNIQHTGNVAPSGRKLRHSHLFQRRIRLDQQVINGRGNMFRKNAVKQRKVRKVEKRIGHHV
jgi:hypothetical protein